MTKLEHFCKSLKLPIVNLSNTGAGGSVGGWFGGAEELRIKPSKLSTKLKLKLKLSLAIKVKVWDCFLFHYFYLIQKLHNKKNMLLPGKIKKGERIASVCSKNSQTFLGRQETSWPWASVHGPARLVLFNLIPTTNHKLLRFSF